MRGAVSKLLSLVVVALVAAGCQSPQAAVGALQESPLAVDLLADAAAPPASTPMPAGAAENLPPPGFVSFCMRFPGQCANPADASPVVTETPAVWRLLNRVNRDVNAAIAPEDDSAHYGRAEYWTIPADGYGDCEDYALTKRQALIAAGLPTDALRIAVVRTWDGERHAVLTVTTNKGDYVLDNMRGEILAWNDTDYTWIERQAASNPWNWVSLQTDGPVGAAVAALPTPSQPATAKPAPVAAVTELEFPISRLNFNVTALLTTVNLPSLTLDKRPLLIRTADLN